MPFGKKITIVQLHECTYNNHKLFTIFHISARGIPGADIELPRSQPALREAWP